MFIRSHCTYFPFSIMILCSLLIVPCLLCGCFSWFCPINSKKGLNWMFPHGMAMLYIFSPIFLKRKFMHFRWNWKINVMENTCIVSPQIFFLRSVKMLRHGLIFRSFTLSSVIYLNRHTIGTISITDTQPTEQHSVINDHSQTIKHVKTLQLPARDYFFLICVRSGTLLRRNCFSGGQF